MAATIQQIVKPTRARGLDTSGNNNHAQIYSGRALEFDGVTDYLTADSAASLADSDFTVAIWIKPTLDGYTGGPGGRILFSFHDSSANNRLFFYITGSDNNIRAYSSSGADQSNTTGALSGSWERLVITKEGTSLKFYRNGVANGTSTLQDTISGSTKFSIGQEWDGSTASDFYLGMMSDFQIWNSVWTADDVTYDYLNPEQLVLNRGGTSLTNSNLKLWYPMNEGHRGNQSYVLDASNTGIGDFMETTTGTTNPYMSEDTGWLTQGFDDGDTTIPVDGSNEKAFYVTDKFVTGGRSLYFKTVSSDSNENIYAQYNFVAGTTYKFFARVWAIDQGTGQYPVLYQSDSRFKNGVSKIATAYGEWQELEMILTCDSSGIGNNQIGGSGGGKTLEFYIDEFWAKPINDKHNATTVFYGDDLFDSGVGDYGDSTGAWAAEGNNTIANDTSALKITYVDNDDGAKLFLKNAADLTEDLVVGRTYRLTFTYKVNQVSGQNFILQINTGDNTTFKSTGTLTQTSFTTVTKDFVANHATNANIRFNNMSSGDILHVKDFTLQEIGIASGWTNADQQLDIPQTALQSYSQMAMFNGLRRLEHNTDAYITHADVTTLSFWHFREEPLGVSTGLVDHMHWGNQMGYRIFQNSSNRVGITRIYEDGGTAQEVDYHSKDPIEIGEWVHMVFVIPKAAGTNNLHIYLNGEKDTFTTSHTMGGNSSTKFRLGYGAGLIKSHWLGCITEVAMYSVGLSESEVLELYNDGKPKDARDVGSSLVGYWKDNHTSNDWVNLANPGTYDLAWTAAVTETMLITAGADSSRDSQGFLMNRQRLTNTLNLPIIEFANNGDVISSNDVEVMNPALTYSDTGFSVECWFKAAMLGEPGFIITHQEASNSGEGFHIRWAGGNTIYAVISDGTNEANAQVSTALNADQWYHIVTSWDHSNKKKYVYIDGILRQVETESSMGTIAPNVDIHIGSRRGEGSQMFIGQIDDVKLYNRILTDGGVTTGQSDSNGLSIASKGEVLRNYKAGKRSHK